MSNLKASVQETLTTFLVMAASALGIASVYRPLVNTHYHVHETSDVYVLPPANQVVLLSLGYRSALADLLWANMLVSQGFHMMERRRFQSVTLFYDAINTLDPQFRDPYLYADALITYQVGGKTPIEDARRAREIMELGTRNLPLDADIWLEAGEFMSYIAPGTYLTDSSEQAQWKKDGIPFLQRAAELSGETGGIALQALGGASILERSGEREASIRFLERTLAVTDDPDVKETIQYRLANLIGSAEAEKYEKRKNAFANLCKKGSPAMKRTMCLALGPPTDPAYCAGSAHENEARCATTWKTWAESIR